MHWKVYAERRDLIQLESITNSTTQKLLSHVESTAEMQSEMMKRLLALERQRPCATKAHQRQRQDAVLEGEEEAKRSDPTTDYYTPGERNQLVELINDRSKDGTKKASESTPGKEAQPETNMEPKAWEKELQRREDDNALQINNISRDLKILDAVAELTLKMLNAHTQEALENQSDMTKIILALEQKMSNHMHYHFAPWLHAGSEGEESISESPQEVNHDTAEKQILYKKQINDN